MNHLTSVNTAINYHAMGNELDKNGDEAGLPAHASSSQDSKGEMTCRICLSEDQENDNPLISPCK
jgi:hypothetical protein